MDGPPTRMMYSPDAGDAACEQRANRDKNETSKRRFMVIGASHYLCRTPNYASCSRDRPIRHDLVVALIERRSNQIVHSGIHNSEFLLVGCFDVTHARKQDASVAHKKTARLDQDSNAKLAQRWYNRVSISADAECG